MNIRNYTSSVSVELTISRIEARLAAAGASSISKHYGPKGEVAALVFSIALEGRTISIRLPANAEACFQAMWKEHQLKVRRSQAKTAETLRAQAQRTAWKLMQDWVDVQISLIVMKQAEFIQVFLPYVWDGTQTLFDSFKSGGFKALPEKCQ